MRGFTYIEVIFTIFLIGVIFVMLGAALSTTPLVKVTGNEDKALIIARSELENLRGAGYANLPASGSFSGSTLSELPSGAGTIAVSSYNAGTKQVTVTVTWQDQNNPALSTLSLSTLITQNGGLP